MNVRSPKLHAPTRDDLERAIENAIDMLNAFDGEPDFEPEETDHSSSEDDFDRPEFARDAALQWDDEPSNDNEPSLASVSCVGSVDALAFTHEPNQHRWDQTFWAAGDRRDLEDEHDGIEPDGDGEAWDQVPRAGTGVIAWNGQHID